MFSFVLSFCFFSFLLPFSLALTHTLASRQMAWPYASCTKGLISTMVQSYYRKKRRRVEKERKGEKREENGEWRKRRMEGEISINYKRCPSLSFLSFFTSFFTFSTLCSHLQEKVVQLQHLRRCLHIGLRRETNLLRQALRHLPC